MGDFVGLPRLRKAQGVSATAYRGLGLWTEMDNRACLDSSFAARMLRVGVVFIVFKGL